MAFPNVEGRVCLLKITLFVERTIDLEAWECAADGYHGLCALGTSAKTVKQSSGQCN
jgi:hypothetical protein